MSWVAAAIVGSSVVSGYMGSKAAKQGAQIQADAARYAADVQQDMFEKQFGALAPYRGTGYQALNQIRSMLPGEYTAYDEKGEPITGTRTGTDYLTRQFGPQDFATYLDPSMQFRMGLGEEATRRTANLGGGALGGNTLKAIQDYAQGLASTEYGNAFNRFQTERGNIYNTLANIAGIGSGAQQQTGQLAQNVAGNIGNLAVGAAGAQAAGTIGSASAIGQGLTGATSGLFLNSLLRPTAQPVATTGGYGSLNYQYPTYNTTPSGLSAFTPA